MKKTLLCLIISTLLIHASCGAKLPIQGVESEYTPPISSAPLDSATSPFWDTSGVDVSYISKTRKLIAFTFDDAPSRYLENLLAVFAAFNETNPDCVATATIFYNSVKFSSDTPTLLQETLSLGFELGNHTHSHFDLTTLNEKELQAEIDKADALLERADGKKRHLLRAPFGRTNDLVKATAKTPLIDWTIDTRDWTGASVDEIYNRVISNLFDGAIVLMHDG